jgi:hypothetical protein
MEYDWIQFYPDGAVVHVEVFVDKLIDYHTKYPNEFSERVIDVVAQVTSMCEERNVSQVCVANLEGVNFYKVNLISLSKLIWKLYKCSNECAFVQSCEISNSGPIFNSIFNALGPFLPPKMVKLISSPYEQKAQEYDE